MGETTSIVGRTAVVTGGARGLGRSMVRALLVAGASVLAVDRDAEAEAMDLDDLGDRYQFLRVDLTADDAPGAVLAACLERFGRVDMLVNNAGTGHAEDEAWHADSLKRFDETSYLDMFRIHALAPFRLMRTFVPIMREQGSGRVVTVTTSLTTMLRPTGMGAPYGAVKAASEALMSIVARELEGSGVTFNVLVPGGPVDTTMMADASGGVRARLLKPEVMGPPVCWLASDDANGETAKRIVASQWSAGDSIEASKALAIAPIGWSMEHAPVAGGARG